MRYFVETVRQQSFTLAAGKLHVTQSAVSKLVRQLELELGETLLQRDGRRLALTDAGRVVFDRAQDALAVVAQLERELCDIASLQQGELVLGIPPMVNVFFPRLIQGFRQPHPGVRLILHEAGGQLIEERVQRGELEIGVSVMPLAPGGQLAHAVLSRHPICLVGRSDAAWASKPQVSLSSLHRQPVVMLSDDYKLPNLLQQAMDDAGVQAEVVARSGQWDFLLAMALSGMGTALLPEPLLARQKLPAWAVVRPLPAKAPQWEVAHIWHRDRYLSHAARAWLSHCKAWPAGKSALHKGT
jgi:DNA-binding transcriptional LysR family regulator